MRSIRHASHPQAWGMRKKITRRISLWILIVCLFVGSGPQTLMAIGPNAALTPWEQEVLPPTLPESLVIEKRLQSTGFQRAAKRTIDTVVLHSCYNPGEGDKYSVEKIIALFSREKVGTHYLIDRSGVVYQLVTEQDIAYHAGNSQWAGRKGVNAFSIGIELINHTEDRFTESQYQALERLLQDIEQRHTIRFVLAHGEIAPERRTDPWNFDWSKVARFRNRTTAD